MGGVELRLFSCGASSTISQLYHEKRHFLAAFLAPEQLAFVGKLRLLHREITLTVLDARFNNPKKGGFGVWFDTNGHASGPGVKHMGNQMKHSRRKVIKVGMTALAAIPLAALSTRSYATQNTAVRAALKFQNTPNGDKYCGVCINFIPNKDKPTNDEAINGCKLYPGDTEICTHCYCNGFVKKPA